MGVPLFVENSDNVLFVYLFVSVVVSFAVRGAPCGRRERHPPCAPAKERTALARATCACYSWRVRVSARVRFVSFSGVCYGSESLDVSEEFSS